MILLLALEQSFDFPKGYGSINDSNDISILNKTLVSWISNHIPSKMWDEITYPFTNFNRCTIQVREWVHNFIPCFIMDFNYSSMPGFKLIHVGKRIPGSTTAASANSFFVGTENKWITCEPYFPLQFQKVHVLSIKTWLNNMGHWHALTLIPAWISNYIHYKVWDEITYPFPNFNSALNLGNG